MLFSVFLAVARVVGFRDINWIGNTRIAAVGRWFAVEYLAMSGERTTLYGVGSLDDARAVATAFKEQRTKEWVRTASFEDLGVALDRIGVMRKQLVGVPAVSKDIDDFAGLVLQEMKERSFARDREATST